MSLAIMGVVTALNFILILYKLSHNRIADGVLDFIIFAVICTLFSAAGQAGLFVGMVASFIVSIYLLFSPPKLPRSIR
jgi:hypothetical protein